MKTLLFTLAAFSFLSDLHAQPGSLVSSFGNNGYVTQNVRNENADPTAFFVQTNGKIVVAGTVLKYNAGTPYQSMFVARLNADGTVDKTFAYTGVIEFGSASYTTTPSAVHVLSNGSVLVAGTQHHITANTDVAYIQKFNSDGSYDESFDSYYGFNTLFTSQQATLTDMQVDGSGKIYICGAKTSPPQTVNQSYIACLNSNGQLNTSFNGTGICVVNFGGSSNFSALKLNGSTLYATGRYASDMICAAVSTTGTLVNSFDTDGKMSFTVGSPGANEYPLDIDVSTSTGKINICGYTTGEPFVAQIHSNGSLDNAFAGNGKLVIPLGVSFNSARSMAYNTSNSDIYLMVDRGNADQINVIRINDNNGNLVTTFGTNGIASYNLINNGYPEARKILNTNGKLFCLGNTYANDIFNTVLPAFYTLDITSGAPVNTFDGFSSPQALPVLRDSYESQSAVFLQDNKLLTIGYAYMSSEGITRGAIQRYLTDGTLDTSFNNYLYYNGQTFTDVLVNPDQTFFVTSSYRNNNGDFFWQVRKFLVHGELDSSFATNGMAQLPINASSTAPNRIIQLNNGSLLVAGLSYTSESVSQVWKMNAAGVTDLNFDGDGVWEYVSPPNTTLRVSDMFVNSSGNIVLVAFSGDFVNDAIDVGFITLAPDGSQVGNMQPGGLQDNANEHVYDFGLPKVAHLPDGRFYLICSFLDVSDLGIKVARYNPDLSLDNTFAINGQRKIMDPAYFHYASSVFITSEEKPVFLYIRQDTASNDFVAPNVSYVHRMDTTGMDDNSFSFDGKALLQGGSNSTQVHKGMIHPNGNMYLAGTADASIRSDYMLCALESEAPQTGIENFAPENGYSIFPNPVSGNVLNLRINYANNEPVSISWLDASGKTGGTLFQGKAESQLMLLLPEIPAGTYFLKIVSENTITHIPFIKS